jgi:uncharacterized protein (TIRG00374 family)
MRRWRPWLISLLVTCVIFWYLLSQIELTQLIDAAASMEPTYLLIFTILLLLGTVARAIRFWLLLGRSVSVSLLILIVMSRNLFIDLLPARLGELSYVYLLTKRGGKATEDGLASVFLAILFDLIALAPLLLLAILMVGSGNNASRTLLATFAVMLGIVGFSVMRLVVPVGNWATTQIAVNGSSSWFAKTVKLTKRTVEALREVQHQKIFARVLLVSMVVRLCKFGSYYFLVLAIMTPLGYPIAVLGFFRVFLGVVSAELAAALPISGLGGFGTFEAAWALSFSQLGFSTEHAVLSGILAHAVSQMVEYVFGLAALVYIMRLGATQS